MSNVYNCDNIQLFRINVSLTEILLLSSSSIIIVAAAAADFLFYSPAVAATTTTTVTAAASQIAVIIISVFCSFRVLSSVAVIMCIFAISYRSI